MKKYLLIIFGFYAFFTNAQLHVKWVEKKEGRYQYCYHQNGKLSTEVFMNESHDYMAQGYAKAFDLNGKEIYNKTTSRSGMLSSVLFTYYENGAIKSAEYNAHPDAGIQWYRTFTYFDESGNKTGEVEMSHDMMTTVVAPYDSTYRQKQIDREELQRMKDAEKLRKEREVFVKDSTEFYINTREDLADGTVLEYLPMPESGARQQVITRSGKIIQITTEYFQVKEGVRSVRRTYYKNGRVCEEFIYETQIWHYRKYDKKGKLLEEKVNQSITRIQ